MHRKTLVPELRPETLLKKTLWHRCFLVNFVKFLRTPFLTEHHRWVLLLLVNFSSIMLKNGQIYFKNDTLKLHSNIKLPSYGQDTLVSANQVQFLLNYTKESKTKKNSRKKAKNIKLKLL